MSEPQDGSIVCLPAVHTNMKITLHTILLITAAIAVALLADAWRSARHDSAQLASTLAAQNASIQQASDREKQRDTELSSALATIAAQKQGVRTPQQAAIAIPSVMPPLPLPISIHLPDLSASPEPNTDAPASISIPQADLKPLYDDLQDCRANSLDSESLKKDLADEKTASAVLIQERNAAIAAAHGGTFWLRLKREAKWVCNRNSNRSGSRPNSTPLAKRQIKKNTGHCTNRCRRSSRECL